MQTRPQTNHDSESELNNGKITEISIFETNHSRACWCLTHTTSYHHSTIHCIYTFKVGYHGYRQTCETWTWRFWHLEVLGGLREILILGSWFQEGSLSSSPLQTMTMSWEELTLTYINCEVSTNYFQTVPRTTEKIGIDVIYQATSHGHHQGVLLVFSWFEDPPRKLL